MTYFTTEDRDGTIVVTLSSGERNTLHSDLLEEGAILFSDLSQNPPEQGVVLTGAGEHFTCGMDINVAAALDEAGRERAVTAVNGFCAGLHRLPCALVGAVNGNSIGAGGIIMLCCDWVYAASGNYKIGLPEAKAGLPFPPVPQVVLDHWLEPGWRRRLALSSMLLKPNEAIGAGMVEATLMPGDLLEKSVTKAKELSAQPGFKACKQQLRARANAEIDAILGG